MKQWIGIGDIHNDVHHLEQFPEIAQADGVIIHGDITIRGNISQAALMIARITEKNATVYAQAGNMDGLKVQEYLEKKTIPIHRKGFELCPNVGIMGVGMSSPTPFQTPGEFADEQLGEWLEETWKDIQHLPHTIVVTHDPPYGTQLDKTSRHHVGSQAVLAFIEKYQPDILLCGHIHESKGKDMIGRTKAVNPGDFSSGGYALIQYQNDSLDVHFKQLVSS